MMFSEFVEAVCDYELSDWQKQWLDAVYKNYAANGIDETKWKIARGNTKSQTTQLTMWLADYYNYIQNQRA